VKLEESLFPKELRDKAVGSSREWGWKLEDIPQVIMECRKLEYGILGGQIQFRIPGGTCELYWRRADPKRKMPGENWADYSKRSCSEFIELFGELVKKTDFEKEGLDWPFIKAKKESGVNILDYLCFVLYPISKSSYRRRRLNNLLSFTPGKVKRLAKIWFWKR